ncbi:MAG: thioredoxin domain-containing protein [Nanoarchaeota archaeon]
MEQKQLDEMDDSFFGEEFIEDDADEQFSASLNSEKEEKPEPTLRLKKMKKMPVKKNVAKKAEKVTKKELKAEPAVKNEGVIIEKVEKNHSEKEIKGETVKESEVKPAKETKPVVETTAPVNPWAEESGESLFKQASTWKALAGIAIILLLLSVFTGGFDFSGKSPLSGAAVSLQQAETKTLEFVNGQLLQPPYEATLTSSEELDNLYKITLAVGGQSIDSYVTKDGRLFFPQGMDMDKPKTEDPVGTSDSTDETAKLDVSADDDPVLGNADAPVTIIEFSDFQCPFCGKFFSESFPKIDEKYIKTGKVKMVFRDFPLEFHPEAEPAALAANCANEQGKFWEFHDLLFANQEALGDAKYKEWAQQLDLDQEKFVDCYKGLKYLDEVRSDLTDGQSYGVSGTPAFFVNGRMVSGAQPYAVFEQIIESELAAAGKSDTSTEQPTTSETEVAAENNPEPEQQVPEVEEPVATESGETAEVTLDAKKWIFQPNEVTVKKGSKVVLTIIPSGLDFTFAIPYLGVEQPVAGATEVSFTADKAGSFDFTCGSCEDWRGMKGTLVVE